MDIGAIARRVSKTAADNAPTILTALGVTTAITTAVLTGKASFKAAEIISREQARHDLEKQSHPFTFKEKVLLVWPQYLPAVGTGAVAIASIIASNRISARRAAALASAYTVSQQFFKDYKDKVIEQLGKEKEQKVVEAVVKERLEKNPPPTIIQTGSNGKCWVYDEYSEQCFLSSPLELEQAAVAVNFQIINDGYASLADFYRELGTTHGKFANDLGWHSPNKLEIFIGSTRDPDGMPVLTLDFRTFPVRG